MGHKLIFSETGEATPTKTGVHARDINPYLHKLFELILYQLFISTGPLLWDIVEETAAFLPLAWVLLHFLLRMRKGRGLVKEAGLTKPKKMNYYAANDIIISSNYTLIITGDTQNITVTT